MARNETAAPRANDSSRRRKRKARIQRREPGAFYVVLFSPPGRTWKDGMRNACAGTVEFPVPTLPKRCICCNDPKTLPYLAEIRTFEETVQQPQIGVPACRRCKDHCVQKGTILEGVVAGGFLLAVVFLIMGYTTAPVFYGVGLLTGIGSVALCALFEKLTRRNYGPGHNGPASVSAQDGAFHLGSANRAFLEHTIALNEDRLRWEVSGQK